MENASNTPSLRFRGYTDAWGQERLGDIAGYYTGGGTPKTSVSSYWNGNIPWFQSADILAGQVYDPEPKKFISDEAVANSATKLVPANSIAVITRVGVGKLAYIRHSYCTSQDFLSFSNLKTNPDFTVYALYKKLNEEIEKVQGTSIKGITKDELLDKEIKVPNDKNEQREIGSFFKELDSLLSLHQRKLSKLQEIKKSLLQNMFPAEGEDRPKIRFAGYTDAWGRERLGDLGFAQSGIGFPESEQGGKSGIPFYKVSDMNNPGNETVMTNANNYVTEDQILRKRWKPFSNNPAIIFAKVGAALMLNRKRLSTNSFLVDNNTMAYVIDTGKWDYRFAKVAFDNIYLPSLAQVGALPSFNAEDVENLEIAVPHSRMEGEKIGEFFFELDSLLSLHQRKLEKLQQIKKALLEQMFC